MIEDFEKVVGDEGVPARREEWPGYATIWPITITHSFDGERPLQNPPCQMTRHTLGD